ncbi:MAG: glycosyltransferase family 4 protein [Archaeoglobaceae archaeon]
MKVLIIAPNISKPYLGPSAVAYNTLRGFSKIDEELKGNGVEITFLSINDEIKRKKVTENIEIVSSRRYPPVSFTEEVQALFRKKRGFNVVHSHNLYEVFPYLISRVSTIYTLHGIPWREIKFKDGLYPKIWLKLMELRLKLYYPKLSRFVAISQYVVEELKAKGFDTSKAVIIENPVSDEFFEVEKKEEQIILYPATLIPLKNQIGFLKAISLIREEMKEYKVVFAGSGDKEYEAKLRDFVSKNGLKVEFLGKVPYEKMPELYSKASIVSLLSFEETFGMAIAEAMATGTPVLASSIPVFRYIVKENETGLLADPNDPKDIAEKLLALINDESLRKRMGREARKEAERRWRAEIIAKKHLELYLSVYQSG